MKPKIKVVFVDLDGTLLQGVDTVSPRTVRLPPRASGESPQ